MSDIILTTLRPEHFEPLAHLQRVCYPTLAPAELMQAEHFAAQYELFSEGQIVVLDPANDNRVIGQGSGFFIDFDFDHPQHTFREICAEFYFTHHDPNGAYYYGADISVHPDYRRRGIGRRIYDARKDVVRRYNRRGIVGGGLIPDYVHHKAHMDVHRYVESVIAGTLQDSTLTFQLKMGFRVRGLLQNYIEDSASDNWATLIEWVNPDFQASSAQPAARVP